MTAIVARVPPTDVAGLPATLSGAVREVLLGQARGTEAPDGPRLLSVSTAIDVSDPISWFEAARTNGGDAYLWRQRSADHWLVGIGAALEMPLDGHERFVVAGARWQSLVRDRQVGGDAAHAPTAGPVLMGGATFLDRPSGDACWAGFERGRLVLPELLLRSRTGIAVATWNLILDEHGPSEDTVARMAERCEDLVARSSVGVATRQVHLQPIRELPTRAGWSSSVARSSGAVGRGRIDKVVLARRLDVRADAAIDIGSVLRRLDAAACPDDAAPVTVFAASRSGHTFLGASPERLIEVTGRGFRTGALAGTIVRGGDATADDRLAGELLASEKDREEHAVVVAMLRETIAPVAATLDIAERPRVMRLPTVQHLATDIRGQLQPGVGILDLVQRLHPTPAVGGWPRAAALDLLDEQERIDRGWYAGPFGWLDAAGDGEFVVAIRSGVVTGDTASLFAGCGVVGDSEPDREWAESSMKLEVLGSALGILERAREAAT